MSKKNSNTTFTRKSSRDIVKAIGQDVVGRVAQDDLEGAERLARTEGFELEHLFKLPDMTVCYHAFQAKLDEFVKNSPDDESEVKWLNDNIDAYLLSIREE